MKLVSISMAIVFLCWCFDGEVWRLYVAAQELKMSFV